MSSSRQLRSNSNTIENTTTELGFDDDTPITISIMKQLFAEHENKIVNKINNEISSLCNIIEKQSKKIQSLEAQNQNLKNALVEQAIHIEKIENISKQDFAIVSGIPDENWESVLLDHLEKIEVETDKNFKPVKVGKQMGNKSRPIKIKFKNVSEKFKAFNSNRDYHENNNSNRDPNRESNNDSKIYFNNDVGTLTQKENYRLRSEKTKLMKDNPMSKVYLTKEGLFVGKNKVDEFNLANQVF